MLPKRFKIRSQGHSNFAIFPYRKRPNIRNLKLHAYANFQPPGCFCNKQSPIAIIGTHKQELFMVVFRSFRIDGHGLIDSHSELLRQIPFKGRHMQYLRPPGPTLSYTSGQDPLQLFWENILSIKKIFIEPMSLTTQRLYENFLTFDGNRGFST